MDCLVRSSLHIIILNSALLEKSYSNVKLFETPVK